jgi:hypothetical protein
MTISIWGRYMNKPPEIIDRATSPTGAAFLVGEYRLAFGKDWKIWFGRKDEEPSNDR